MRPNKVLERVGGLPTTQSNGRPIHRNGFQPTAPAGGKNLLAIAWESRWIIVACTLTGVFASWAALQQAAPKYRSSSRILIERNLPRSMEGDVVFKYSSNFLNTQAELIRSTSVLGAVAEQPEIRRLPSLAQSTNRLTVLRQAVEVSPGDKDDTMTISAELADGKDSAQVVEAVIQAYIERYAEKRNTDLVAVITVLGKEKKRRDQELDDCRTKLDEFRQQNASIAVQINDQNVANQHFGVLANELNAVEMAILNGKARYLRIQDMFKRPSQRPFLLEMAFGETSDGYLGNLRGQVQDLELSLRVTGLRYGEDSRKIRLLREQLEHLKEQIENREESLIKAFVSNEMERYETLQEKRAELQTAYDERFEQAAEVSGKLVQLESLTHELARAEQNCDVIDDQIKKINLSEEVGAMNVTVMEPATTGYQSYPIPSKFFGMGFGFGAVVGCGLAWLRDFLDHRLRSVDEITETLDLPIIGTLPRLPSSKDRVVVGRVVHNQPNSSAAEAFRTVRTALHFELGGDDSQKIVVVTSPTPGDGKSTSASNLAIALSQSEKRVLVLDADLRRPTQATIFGLPEGSGLSCVLADKSVSPFEAIQPSGIDRLDILPTFRIPSNPVELLSSEYFSDLLETLAEKYDKIVVDSPPVVPIADARIIAAQGDCTLLVLRAERSTRRLSIAARDELLRVRAAKLGLIVNDIPQRKQGYGYGYGYGSYGYGANERRRSDEREYRAKLANNAARRNGHSKEEITN